MSNHWHRALLTASVLAPLTVIPALAGPNGANVVGGSATVQGQGTASVTVNQTSQNAIINWQTFNIGAGETTNILMPNASSTQLDRVTGGLGPSQIFGSLNANGKVFLVNPDGFLFGAGSRINVGSLLATTSDIANSDFMAGRYNFNIPGNPSASIANQGMITAQTSGFAALVAPGVRNTGTITAWLGRIGLTSANTFALDLYGDRLIQLNVSDSIASQVIDVSTGQPLKSLVSNTGKLKANGGAVQLTAVAARQIVDSVINNSGVIEANSVGMHNGMIVLQAATAANTPAGAPTQTVNVSGTLSASGKRKGTTGGTILVTGENIAVTGATISATGANGGGAVLIGGDWGGGHPNTSLVANASAYLQNYAVPTASTVSIDAATTINASATSSGNGGKVIVWSNEATALYGTILAQGGAQSGNGGFVETSGAQLTFNGTVNTSAPAGKTGTWLLDPTNLTIDATAATTIGTDLATTSITLVTNADGTTSGPGNTSPGAGDIIVASAISWSSANTLTLSAYHDIDVNASITSSGGGNIVLRADNSGTDVGTVVFSGGSASTSGAVSIFYNPVNNPGNGTINSSSYTTPTDYSGNVSGGAALTAYMLINNINDLQNVQNNLSGTYALGANIDASATATWDAGFVPIGNLANEFSGSMNGNGYVINNLTINSSAAYVGLFGISSGLIENIGINNINLTAAGWSGPGDYAHIGALAGINNGTVATSYATGTITSNSPYETAPDTGGLVGTNTGLVSQSYASVNVTEKSTGTALYLGGLVGWNQGGTVSQSYATGVVTNTSAESAEAGGLIGYNSGTVTQTYSTGTVTGLGDLGGLIGANSGAVSFSYWDTQTSGQLHSSGSPDSFGLTTAEFGETSSFGEQWTFGTTPGGSGWVIVDTDGSLNNANGAAGATRPMLLSEWSTTITNAHQLQLMELDPTANYTLANSINLGPSLSNASDVWGPNGSAGFVPIGNANTNFTGTFNGNGNTVSNLAINSSAPYVGLFGYLGTTGVVSNLGLANADIASTDSSTGTVAVGSIAGLSNGTIANSYATGVITIGIGGTNTVSFVDAYAGGLVGSNGDYASGASIANSYANVAVNVSVGGADSSVAVFAGGLVGYNGVASIANSSATGAVSVSVSSIDTSPNNYSNYLGAYLGGLVGYNAGSIAYSNATGAVSLNVSSTNTGYVYVSAGGLIGENSSTLYVNDEDIVYSAGGSIIDSYATGKVSVGVAGSNTSSDSNYGYSINAYLGGLVGYNNGGSITNSDATGAVTLNVSSTYTNAYAYGSIDVYAGGLVGENGSAYYFNNGVIIYTSGGGGIYNVGTVFNSASVVTLSNIDSYFDYGESIVSNSGNSIVGSYATGAVSINVSSSASNPYYYYDLNTYLGGLVGNNYGNSIANSHATGAVTLDASGANTNAHGYGYIDAYAGGLVGGNSNAFSVDYDGNVVANFGGSIADSYATGPVSVSVPAVNPSLGYYNTYVAAGGLIGYSYGTSISNSSASGAVSISVGGTGYVEAGGLVGDNGPAAYANDNGSIVFVGGGSITNSYATGPVSSDSNAAELGGLVGQNDPGAVITNSQAYGAVTSTANLLPSNGSNCSLTSTCQYAEVGGFVGFNYGTITGTTWTTAPANCAASYTCAGGNVAVGPLGQGGGFAGINQGIINYAFATGNVTGAAGLPDTPGNVFDSTTQIAGFVAENQGQISNSSAAGTVGTAGTMWLSAGGFVGSNAGTITSSLASGAVVTGDHSTAGGFANGNSPDSNTCPGCTIGDGFNNAALITNSLASGSVTVGASSVAGGFAGSGGNSNGQSGGSFINVGASGAVNADHDSIVGGLVGALLLNASIANSSAQNPIVASSGANSIVGGIVGLNFGTISDTTSSSPVSGTSDSYIGGITGINLGSVTGSSTDPAITGSGGNNFVGGIAGLNLGAINNSTALVDLASGSASYTGGIAGVNGSYSNDAGAIANSSFPSGTITNSNATGNGFGAASGASTPAFTPPLPSWLSGCSSYVCTVLTGGSFGSNTSAGPTDNSNFGNYAEQQVAQFVQTLNLIYGATTPPPLITPIDLTSPPGATNGPGGGPGGNGGSGGGSLASGHYGGNGAPPGVRLIDMPHMPLPPGSGLPPLGETRFSSNEVMVQFDVGMTLHQIAQIAQRFGLTVEATQSIGMLGRAVYTFRIPSGETVREVISQIDAAGLKTAVQPNYSYGLTQDLTGSLGDQGDVGQYVVKKLDLGAVHRLSKGDNVVIAVIDSEVDASQPDFSSAVIDRFDAGCGASAPDAHGTGMAGAIGSHRQLLGVAPNAKIIAICAFGGTGGAAEATSVKIIRGLDYAIKHGARIVNMSFAGPYDPALAQALQVAREKGVLIVAAAGNAGPKSPPLYPGADPNVMAVTATDQNDRVFPGANQGKYIAVASPGVNVLVPAPDAGVQFTTGTSVATANVSGVAALLLSEKPTLTPEDVRSILVSTAKHLGSKGTNPQYGAGLVDPLRALQEHPTAPGQKSVHASLGARAPRSVAQLVAR